MKNINVENVQNGIQSEGFDYYMEHYGRSDLAGTELESTYNDFVKARGAMMQALLDAGVNMDD